MLGSKFGNSKLMEWVSIALYGSLIIYLVGFGYYLVPYILLLLVYLFIIMNIKSFKILNWFSEKPIYIQTTILFLLALFLRFLFLSQNQVITRDIEMYVFRTQATMAGEIPYQDFAVNKPPLFLYLLYSIGTMLGSGQIQFRAFFSILDAFIVVIIFHISQSRLSHQFSVNASFAYALCPLSLVAIGLSGHYEPVVVIFLLFALVFLLKRRLNLSAISLGIAFAFKLFPIVLLPFLLGKIHNWKQRIIYITLFLIPFVLSIIPILIISPDAFGSYMIEQTISWTPKKSFAFAFELLFSTNSVFGVKFSLLNTLFFFVLIFILFISWIRKQVKYQLWFKLIIVIYIIYYGLGIGTSFLFYKDYFGFGNPYSIMAVFALIYFPLMFFVYDKYIKPLEIKIIKKDELYVLSSFVLILFIFSSSQFNPWYILWVVPLILVIKNWKVRLLLLWLVFWNFEGFGISLLPGLVLA